MSKQLKCEYYRKLYFCRYVLADGRHIICGLDRSATSICGWNFKMDFISNFVWLITSCRVLFRIFKFSGIWQVETKEHLVSDLFFTWVVQLWIWFTVSYLHVHVCLIFCLLLIHVLNLFLVFSFYRILIDLRLVVLWDVLIYCIYNTVVDSKHFFFFYKIATSYKKLLYTLQSIFY